MNKIKKYFWNIALVISIGLFAYSAYNVIKDYTSSYIAKKEVTSLEADVFKTNSNNNLEAEEINESGEVKNKEQNKKKEYKILDYDKLYSINSDAVGWIEIPGTKLSEPLVIGKDNDKYLWYNFYGKRYPLTGAIFIDYKNNKNLQDPLTYIFGHHMYDESKFTVLKKFLNNDFLENHKELRIYDRDGIKEYEIVKGIDLDEDTELYNIDLNKNYNERKRLFKEKLGIDLKENDKYLMLITCKSVHNSDIRTCLFCKLKA